MAASSAFLFSAAKVTNPFPPSSQEGEWVQSLLAATCSEYFYFLHFSNVCSRLISFLSSGMFLHLPQWTQLQDHNLPLYPSYDYRALEFQYNRLKDMAREYLASSDREIHLLPACIPPPFICGWTHHEHSASSIPESYILSDRYPSLAYPTQTLGLAISKGLCPVSLWLCLLCSCLASNLSDPNPE